eukprot:m.18433 g.18433  ORF g.18433 m.18433 type:complete len:329 (+) comp27660_c0_seq1:2432-3418(+)
MRREMASGIVGSVVGAVVLGYICTSTALFFFPCLIHRKKRPLVNVKHISHRGGAGEELENTIAAFRKAVENGTEMLEMDVHLTKDGKVVVSHDNNLERVTGVGSLISETCYADLPRMKKVLPVQFMKDCTVQVDHDGNVIPTLTEVFEAFPDFPINLDVKFESDELINKVYDLICKHKRQRFTIWGSMIESNKKKIYAKDSTIPMFFSAKQVLRAYVLLLTGLLPFWPIKEGYFESCWPYVLMERAGFNPPIPPILKFLVKTFDSKLVHRAMYYHLKKRGIVSYVWVLNEEEDYEVAMNLGATGIMTDLPTNLSAYFARCRHVGSDSS